MLFFVLLIDYHIMAVHITWVFSSPISPSRNIWTQELHSGPAVRSQRLSDDQRLSDEELDDFDFDEEVDGYYPSKQSRAATPSQGNISGKDEPRTHVQPQKFPSPLKTPQDASDTILATQNICRVTQECLQDIFDKAKHGVNQHPKKLQRALIADLERARLEFS